MYEVSHANLSVHGAAGVCAADPPPLRLLVILQESHVPADLHNGVSEVCEHAFVTNYPALFSSVLLSKIASISIAADVEEM